MAEAKAKPVVETKPSAWETPKETWQYVTIPEEDPLGKEFAPIGLNKDRFLAGQTYHVPAEVATYINDRIKVFNRSCVRLLQPNIDQKAVRDVAAGTATSVRYAVADGSHIQTV